MKLHKTVFVSKISWQSLQKLQSLGYNVIVTDRLPGGYMFNQVYANRMRTKQTSFQINDIVTWTSHSPKNMSTKTGIVLMVIEPGEDVSVKFKDWHKYSLSPHYGKPRAIRSYLIAVLQKNTHKPKLYFPFPKGLKLIA